LKILHSWDIDYDRARQEQYLLAKKIITAGELTAVQYVAGVDVSISRIRDTATAAVVVLSYPSLEVVETQTVHGKPGFPYIPGLLSFREAPLILQACRLLKINPDLFLVDGQGIAHPRRMGLASHLGLFLDTPTIGCAKSRLCGEHESPGNEFGDYAWLLENEDTIGAVLRTKHGTKSLYISVGHKIDLNSALKWVLACCRGYRLPEPTRLAHQAAKKNL